MPALFQLTSPAFADDAMIPDRFTCQGENRSPELIIHRAPTDTKSLALIMHDPDAPHGDFIHWTVWNIDSRIGRLPENDLPNGAQQGSNDFGHNHYDGPCPPSGVHRYLFDLFALDAALELDQGAPAEDLHLNITRHAIAKTSLVGRFGAKALA